MSNAMQLPFFTPVFSSTPEDAAAGITLEQHPTGYNQILNQCTTIACTRKFLRGYTSPQVTIPRLTIGNFSCIEKYTMGFKFMFPYYKEIIKELLKNGFYVLFYGIDDFYLPGKCWYGIRHMSHDGIICGYDDDAKTFKTIVYDINWIYNMIDIPQKCFDEGIQSVFDMGKAGTIYGFKAKDAKIELNKKIILKYLKDHINSTIDKYSLNEDGKVVGVAVYDLLSMYIDKLKDGSIPSDKMDWRSFRPIWEHKKCMYDRLLAVENLEGWSHIYSEEYAPLVELSNHIRGMYAMYHKNNNCRLLDLIKKELIDLKEREIEILRRFTEELEKAV